jgi:hypothetical protein
LRPRKSAIFFALNFAPSTIHFSEEGAASCTCEFRRSLKSQCETRSGRTTFTAAEEVDAEACVDDIAVKEDVVPDRSEEMKWKGVTTVRVHGRALYELPTQRASAQGPVTGDREAIGQE